MECRLINPELWILDWDSVSRPSNSQVMFDYGIFGAVTRGGVAVLSWSTHVPEETDKRPLDKISLCRSVVRQIKQEKTS